MSFFVLICIAELDESSKINQSSMYAFDHIFGSDSKTNEIYGPVCHDIVQSVMGGVNGTIFAYVCTNTPIFSLLHDIDILGANF